MAWTGKWLDKGGSKVVDSRLAITFASGVGLDPVITGGTNIKWLLDGVVVATGGTPSPGLSVAGKYVITMDNYLDVSSFNCATDSVVSVDGLSNISNVTSLDIRDNLIAIADISRLVNLKLFFCRTNKIKVLDFTNILAIENCTCYANEIDALSVPHGGSVKIINAGSNNISELYTSEMPLLKELYLNSCNMSYVDVKNNLALSVLVLASNVALDVDRITDDIYAIKDTLGAGLSVSMSGTCPSVSPTSETKILEMVQAPYNFTWTRNYP